MDVHAGLPFVFTLPPPNIKNKVRPDTENRLVMATGGRGGWAKWVKGVQRFEALGMSWTAW